MSDHRALKILHLEDDRMFSELLGIAFRRAGMEIDLLTIDSVAAFWSAIERGGVDIVISDGTLPGYEGLSVLKELRARSFELPVVFLSGTLPADGPEAHLAAGATDYLVKDDLSRVVDCVRTLSSGETPASKTPPPAAGKSTAAAKSSAVRSEWSALSRLLIHDARNPLWRIQGYAELLRDEYGSALGDDGRTLIGEVWQGTQELRRVLEQIRRVLEVSAAPMSVQNFDLSRAANTIAFDLSANAPARVVEWRVQEGLEVEADGPLMTLLLENLLSNAFKFTAERALAYIEVGALEPGLGRAFFVRDNGVGFAPADRELLFAPSRRVRTEEDRSLGLGLALVEQIMQRHGGRVWCEGVPDAGAMFCFAF